MTLWAAHEGTMAKSAWATVLLSCYTCAQAGPGCYDISGAITGEACTLGLSDFCAAYLASIQS